MSFSVNENRWHYLVGTAWFVLSLIVSVTNDAFSKFLSNDLPFVEVVFLRFFFGSLSLIPFMIYYGKKSMYTSRIGLHVVRGVLLFCAIALWVLGLMHAPITVATTVTFTIPMFVLLLAGFFLKERVTIPRWLATVLGFIGIFIVVDPAGLNFSPLSLTLVFSTLMFATLDVINKKYVVKESMLAMLFYTALVTMLIAAVPTFFVWKTPTLKQMCFFFLLGCGANLILYCLLKAFRYAEASAVAPFRYIELIISAFVGWIFFQEAPTQSLFVGSLIIIPCSLFLVYTETKRKKSSFRTQDTTTDEIKV